MNLYWLVFGPAKFPHWWNRFLHPQFQHCVLLKWDGFEWFMIHGGMEGIGIEVVREPLGRVQGMTDYIQVSRGTPPENHLRIPWIIAPFTCVEVIKAVLGIKAPLLITPYQLYHWATRHPAEVIHG